jgi:transcriptional regulator with XRE-family HTH domain
MDTQPGMKARSTSTISPVRVREAVKALRTGLKETQQAFSKRLGVGIATAVRYELSLAPHGRMLAKLAQIAVKEGFQTQAKVFRDALNQELGLISTAMLGNGVDSLMVQGRRENPPRTYKPEQLPEVYDKFTKRISRVIGRSVTAVHLVFYGSDGTNYIADVAVPRQSSKGES